MKEITVIIMETIEITGYYVINRLTEMIKIIVKMITLRNNSNINNNNNAITVKKNKY